ncbi:hypothetical protein Corgl_0219 [Coriobacterium glomerans PW2]|uniref:Zinc-ribbon domain-containing protein n=2 Tax=Coriobacterium TaxID=33870 RepID=F2N707_CORGP|nr:hypothetical protein Corgl_0219 [Coriobacterium glomerans PW2]
MYCSTCGEEIQHGGAYCPKCGREVQQGNGDAPSAASASPCGRSLLDELCFVRDSLLLILEQYTTQASLVLNYRQEQKRLESRTVGQKSEYGLFVFGIAIVAVVVLKGLLTGKFDEVVLCMAILALFWRGWTTGRRRLLIVGLALLVGIAFVGITNIIHVANDAELPPSAVFVYIGSYAVAVVIALIAAKTAVTRRNAKVDAENKEIRTGNARALAEYSARYDCTVREIDRLRQELLERTASWFPPDYYNVRTVESFIMLVKNHRASDVSEMVNLYETDAHRRNVEAYMHLQSKQMELMLVNQQEIARKLEVSNLINAGNFVLNAMNVANTSAILDRL